MFDDTLNTVYRKFTYFVNALKKKKIEIKFKSSSENDDADRELNNNNNDDNKRTNNVPIFLSVFEII